MTRTFGASIPTQKTLERETTRLETVIARIFLFPKNAMRVIDDGPLQLPKGLDLNLPDPLTADIEPIADLGQRQAFRAEAKDCFFPRIDWPPMFAVHQNTCTTAIRLASLANHMAMTQSLVSDCG